MSYEVQISKHWQDNKFNVDLISWQGKEGLVFGRAFGVSRQEADQEAIKQSNLYHAKIVEVKT
mgnify:FL=1|tara:strand:- start:556 stop:744 length:189 start_codon:yes stop_codon:yes gene_type:complete